MLSARTSSQRASMARAKCTLPKRSEKLRRAVLQRSVMALSSSVLSLGWGTTLSSYLAVMVSTRLNRLPRSLARSELIRVIRAS